jgi:hypothetical protein
MADNDFTRKMRMKLKVLQAELRLRERNKNASLKGYNRTAKMIEELERRIEKCDTKK